MACTVIGYSLCGLSSVCRDMFCPANCAGQGTCVFDLWDADADEKRYAPYYNTYCT